LPTKEEIAGAFEPVEVTRNDIVGVFGPEALEKGKGRGSIVPDLKGFKGKDGVIVEPDASEAGLATLNKWLGIGNAFNAITRKIKQVSVNLFRDDSITNPETDETDWQKWLAYMQAPLFSPYGETIQTLQQRAVQLNNKLYAALQSTDMTNPEQVVRLRAIADEAAATNQALEEKMQAAAERKLKAKEKADKGQTPTAESATAQVEDDQP
jgi:hypothetical protein